MCNSIYNFPNVITILLCLFVGLLLRITSKTATGYTASVTEIITPCSIKVHPGETINITLPEMEISQCPCPHLQPNKSYLVAGYTDSKKETLILNSRTFHVHINMQLISQNQPRRQYILARLEKMRRHHYRMKKMLTNMFSYKCPTPTVPPTPNSTPTPIQHDN